MLPTLIRSLTKGATLHDQSKQARAAPSDPASVFASQQDGQGPILDEFVATTGYHRKYGIRLLRHGPPPMQTGRCRVHRICDQAVKQVLTQIREISGRLCSRRLHAFLPEIMDVLEPHRELVPPADTKALLLNVSRATMDRLLKPARARKPQRGLRLTQLPLAQESDPHSAATPKKSVSPSLAHDSTRRMTKPTSNRRTGPWCAASSATTATTPLKPWLT